MKNIENNLRNVFMLLLVLLFVAACSTGTPAPDANDLNEQNNEQNNEPASNQMPDVNSKTEPVVKDEVASSEKISMDKIYNYAAISKFTYDMTTTAAGETIKTTFDYTLSSDTVNGKAAWLSTSEMDTQGAKVLSKIWTDKVTFGCLKVSSVITFNGQDMETPAECPKEGPGASTTATATPELDYLGTESVTVPAGTFTAKKYLLEGKITYWYSESVPIPVKVTYADTTAVMELVKWS